MLRAICGLGPSGEGLNRALGVLGQLRRYGVFRSLIAGGPSSVSGWRAYLRILLGLRRGLPGLQMVSDPNFHR